MISGSIRMIAIATEPTNAFNADYLDNWLRPMSLAERDELWSVRATYHAKSEGNAIDTLIQWVLVNGLKPIEETRARLAAITLAWLTTLSHRSVRDMATKALAVWLVRRRAWATQLITDFGRLNEASAIDRPMEYRRVR